MATIEVLEHTADIGLRVSARDAPEAFGALAEAMFDIVVDRNLVEPDRTWTIQVAAPNWSDLVVAFLEELLYRYDAHGIVLRACRIREIGDTYLTAEISGEQVDTSRHEFGVQIKAVTYHQLKAAETADGFEIQVISTSRRRRLPGRSLYASTMKDFLRTADLSVDDLRLLLELSRDFKQNPGMLGRVLEGQQVLLYFNKPSTRTRLSFAWAILQLGGFPMSVGPGELQVQRGETIEDTGRVISSFARALVIRTFADDEVRRFAAGTSVPVINALTDGHHPCQSLADVFTLQERFGSLSGFRMAYLGDGNNVAHSLIEAAAIAGIGLTLACPRELEPNESVVRQAGELASRTGARIAVTQDPDEAVKGAHAVYTDVWASMGLPESERSRRTQLLAPYRVDQRLMSLAAGDAVFMHCLPAHRGEEVTPEVMDGARSIAFEQAANRGPTQLALLYALTADCLQGSLSSL